ncbi:phosphopantetheine-binding protein [Nocardia jejuensis]|uniref:phosphopantetheine-binding protein n=1 Tax=Nocardia jejuensis TaxID=328049 RepID=UPI0008324319|nr:phosphopantetheine-binding protein [Nocardia jejuensis]
MSTESTTTENNTIEDDAVETVTALPAVADRVADPEQVLAVIEDKLAVGRTRMDLRLTDSIKDDIDIDSLSLMEALTRVEEEYGIELIDHEEIYTVVTVGDLVVLIQRIYRIAHDSTAIREAL